MTITGIKLLTVAGAIVLSSGALVLHAPKADAQNKPPTPVNITSPLPLPVTGTVGVNGPVNVVSPTPLPVTGTVAVSGPVPVQQSGTWTITTQTPVPTRFGPTRFPGGPGAGIVVPEVPEGKTFVVTNIYVASLDPFRDVISARCEFWLQDRSPRLVLLIMPLQNHEDLNYSVSGSLTGSVAVTIPLNANERLIDDCLVTYSYAGSSKGEYFRYVATVTGYFIPAAQ